MDNRFVSSTDLEEAKRKRAEEWKAVYERLGQKPPEEEKEEYDPRTLFERLQEQKMKKEEAFQEMTRFSNLIHRLDEDEIEFLAMVENDEKIKEKEKLKKVEKELEEFRRAAAEADITALSKPILPTITNATDSIIDHQQSQQKLNQPKSINNKLNLKHDVQQTILANAIKKSNYSSSSSSTSSSRKRSLIIDRIDHDEHDKIDKGKKIKSKTKDLNEQSKDVKRIKIKEKEEIPPLIIKSNVSKSTSQNNINTNTNPLELLLGYDDDDDSDD